MRTPELCAICVGVSCSTRSALARAGIELFLDVASPRDFAESCSGRDKSTTRSLSSRKRFEVDSRLVSNGATNGAADAPAFALATVSGMMGEPRIE
ncbi:hypothetical protein GQ600_20651 [Phytophthora cactorum]|nr:hypothetical protein GQ600_20651 [Phytophthora cactorum]